MLLKGPSLQYQLLPDGLVPPMSASPCDVTMLVTIVTSTDVRGVPTNDPKYAQNVWAALNELKPVPLQRRAQNVMAVATCVVPGRKIITITMQRRLMGAVLNNLALLDVCLPCMLEIMGRRVRAFGVFFYGCYIFI